MKININLLLTLTFAFLLSCTSEVNNTEKKQTLTIVEPNFPETLFPPNISQIEQAHIITQIHDGLMSWDIEKEKPVGLLVSRWVENNNNDKITFHLHDQVYFHDDPCFNNNEGRLVNSHDVKFSFEYAFWHRAVNNKSIGLLKHIVGGEAYFNSCDSLTFKPGRLEGIKVIDSLTFEIHLTATNPSFIKSLVTPDLMILPHEGIEKYGENCIVGSGAFKIDNINQASQTIELSKNNKYYHKDAKGNKLPFLDKITFVFEATPAKSLRMMRDHQADLLLSMEQKHIKAFVEDNIELFEKKFPDLVLKQAKGLEESNIYLIKRGNIENLTYSALNILYLDEVKLKDKVEKK